ncbi:MAG: hypothetical protein GF334_02325 [Candidatus Altiarchaeales archaeon]|nr:hypothetical protein [Candidatus Altiarchaeales archaeon]
MSSLNKAIRIAYQKPEKRKELLESMGLRFAGGWKEAYGPVGPALERARRLVEGGDDTAIPEFVKLSLRSEDGRSILILAQKINQYPSQYSNKFKRAFSKALIALGKRNDKIKNMVEALFRISCNLHRNLFKKVLAAIGKELSPRARSLTPRAGFSGSKPQFTLDYNSMDPGLLAFVELPWANQMSPHNGIIIRGSISSWDDGPKGTMSGHRDFEWVWPDLFNIGKIPFLLMSRKAELRRMKQEADDEVEKQDLYYQEQGYW